MLRFAGGVFLLLVLLSVVLFVFWENQGFPYVWYIDSALVGVGVFFGLLWMRSYFVLGGKKNADFFWWDFFLGSVGFLFFCAYFFLDLT